MEILNAIMNFVALFSQTLMPYFTITLVYNAATSAPLIDVIHTVREDPRYFVKLCLYNFTLPIIVAFILTFIPLDPAYIIGLIILYLSSGAPLLIAFVQQTKADIRYAVATMVILMFQTVISVPLLLPLLISGTSVTSIQILQGMLTTVILPLIIGIITRLFWSTLVLKIRPILLKAQAILMNIAVYGMLIGLLPELIKLVGSGVILTGIVLIILSFIGGWLIEGRTTNFAKRYSFAFSSGQRNAAIAFSIALSNFADPKIIIAMNVVSAISTMVLNFISQRIGKKAVANNAES